ncbi:MAG: Hpt domain-containing protein [Verrucomicrobiota bacterium JB022]|nr:Hpt domain-containing protein [Verrucomicrobiota bacterium JB022]
MELSHILAEPVVDREQFDMLVETGEDAAAELIQELLDLFREESGPRLDALQASLGQNDTVAIGKHAHSLAGASANLGALRLSKLCRKLETETNAGNLAALPEIARHIRAEYDRAVQQFEVEIEQLKS